MLYVILMIVAIPNMHCSDGCCSQGVQWHVLGKLMAQSMKIRNRSAGLPMHVCMYVFMYVCMHACMHVCMHACMYAGDVCMYVCMCT